MKLSLLGQSLDGGDLFPLDLNRQGQAGEDGFAVREDRAGTALSGPASLFGAIPRGAG